MNNVDKMTTSHLTNTMKIASFKLKGNDSIYGINVDKVREFIKIKDLKFVRHNNDLPFVEGLVSIRDKTILVLNLDKWFNKNFNSKIEDYKILAVIEFNQTMLGVLVDQILNIHDVPFEDVKKLENFTEKITYICDVYINNNKNLCAVIDVEGLLDEINPDTIKNKLQEVENYKKINNKKLILVAEDSKVAKDFFKKIFEKLSINYRIFDNGDELFNFTKTIKEEDIGVIITDLEMPIMNGYELIKNLRTSSNFKNIPIIVNTSMSNEGVKIKIKNLNANEFIEKTNPKQIIDTILKYI